MLFWHQKVWIGDGDKPGEAVYWDTKEKKAYIREKSKILAKGGKKRGVYAGIGTFFLIVLTDILRGSGFHVKWTSSKSSDFWIAILALIYTAVSVYFMNRHFYPRHAEYKETTLTQAEKAIKNNESTKISRASLYVLLPILFLLMGVFSLIIVKLIISGIIGGPQ